MIVIQGLKKNYYMGDNVVSALQELNLEIAEGDFVAIMGPSGSGKTTLMQILGLLDIPTSGSYRLYNGEVSGLTEDELAILRRERIGFIFQQFNLLPRLSAAENVALPTLYSKNEKSETNALELLKKVGLGDRADHYPNQLSGGQQQRVAIARSLINQPRLLFADEPTGNLDSHNEKEILDLLTELNSHGLTVVIVTHSEQVGQRAKRVIRMRDGQVQSDVRHDPQENLERTSEKKQETEDPQHPQSSPRFNVTTSEIPTMESLHLEDAGISWFKLSEFFKQGVKTLWASKARSLLSMLGILIGVAAVVAMLALGSGAQKAVESELSALGSNLLSLKTGAQRVGGVMQDSSATRLTLEDAQAISGLPHVVAVTPVVTGRAQVTFQNHNWNSQIQGTGSSYPVMRSSTPIMGRFFTHDEDAKRSRVAVLGITVARELFGTKNPLGEMIKINKVLFQVIGILPPKGTQGPFDRDDLVLIPASTAMRRLFGKTYVDSIDIQAASAQTTSMVEALTLNLMIDRKRIPPARQEGAFAIRNMAEIQEALSSTSRTMSLLLASIAAISLIVGGIGIMNIMLVSITERTKEIGLRKAIGAKQADIMMQFLIEAVAISGIGGAFGVVLGVLVSVSLSYLVGWSIYISAPSILLSFFFSAAIGVTFGLLPAQKAARRHPIEALRYE